VTSSSGPLHGLRVLEVGRGIAGSFAGAMLTDLGAEVVKIDPFSTPADIESMTGTSLSSYENAYNRRKRSVLLDLEAGEGLQLVRRLVQSSDVVLVDTDPDHAASLGLDAAAVEAAKPDAVYCRVSGLGTVDGTGAAESDLVVQALSGCMDLTGNEGGPPFQMGIALCDLAAGFYAAIGVLGALVGARNHSARQVDVAKIDVGAVLLSYMAVGFFADGEEPSRVGTGHSTIFPYNAFRAADGDVVVAPFTQRFWRKFCAGIEREDLLESDEYKDFARRVSGKAKLMKDFEPIFLTKTVQEWLEVFARVDVPAGPVLSVAQALALDQTVVRGMASPARAADGGLRTLGSPFNIVYSDGTSFTVASS
jgi:crotonobetainyl-CoA:carnitine CoA-transferase CaiB-like acyl-CoA transferase